MSPIADESAAIHLHAVSPQCGNFLEKCYGIEYDAVPDHAAAAGTQHATGNQLQDEFLAIDDDGMAGIVSAGIASHYGEILRQDIDDLTLAFVSPLGADDDRSSCLLQTPTPQDINNATVSTFPPRTGDGAHSLPQRTALS